MATATGTALTGSITTGDYKYDPPKGEALDVAKSLILSSLQNDHLEIEYRLELAKWVLEHPYDLKDN